MVNPVGGLHFLEAPSGKGQASRALTLEVCDVERKSTLQKKPLILVPSKQIFFEQHLENI